jgi:Protein of unknown function (DUF1329)
MKIRFLKSITTSMVTLASISSSFAAESTVPANEGANVPLPGYSYGKVREEFWKYKDEKPVVIITSANLQQYADKLSPGELDMFKNKPGYEMRIYPTHRSCVIPDWVKANSKENAGFAKLDATGNYLVTAKLPGAPFPEPKTGAEAMWNYLVHYRGVGYIYPRVVTAASPAPGNTTWIEPVEEPWTMYYPWGKKGQTTPDQVNDKYFYIYYGYTEPTAFAGQGANQLYHFSAQIVETYYYFPGQRRVRRLPAYNYDTPQIGFENNYTQDDIYMFYGAIDRYDWKIVGHKDLYVPYNSFGMYRFDVPYHNVMKDDVINPANRRYELHTVLQVEGTIKSGSRNISEKRVLYLDEDSWNATSGEDYDGQGKLWKVREGFMLPVWELGSACDSPSMVNYNLSNGRYVHDGGITGQGKDIQWFTEPGNNVIFTDDYYSSEALRGRSER